MQLVSRFTNGLREQIKDELSLHTVWTLSEAVNLALKVEAKQAKQATRTSFQRKTYIESSQMKTNTPSFSQHPNSQPRPPKPNESQYTNVGPSRQPMKTTPQYTTAPQNPNANKVL